MERDSDTIDLRVLLRALARRWATIVGLTVAVGGLSMVISLARTTQYEATAKLLFRDPGFDQRVFGAPVLGSDIDAERQGQTNVELVSLDVVAAETADALGGDLVADDIVQKVDVSPEGQSDVVAITATDPDPKVAAQVANEFATQFIAFRRSADRAKVRDAVRLVTRQLNRLSDAARSGPEGRALQDQVGALTTLSALQTGNAELVQEAERPDTPASPKPARDVGVGLLLGLMLGIGVALLRERADHRIREIDDFSEGFGLPVLATVPELSDLGERPFGEQNGDGQAAVHSFLMLRNQLRYFNVDKEIGVILVTSAAAREGKTTVARHLAACGALAGESTVLVEADLHQPTLAQRLGLTPSPGLAEYLSGQGGLDDVIQHHEWSIEGAGGTERHGKIDVIAAGSLPPNPAELLESRAMGELVKALRERYATVIVDTPPVLQVADAIPMIQLTDGVLVVAQIDRTTDLEVKRLSEQLRDLRAPALGVVVNHVRPRRGYGYGGYGYGYGRQVKAEARGE